MERTPENRELVHSRHGQVVAEGVGAVAVVFKTEALGNCEGKGGVRARGRGRWGRAVAERRRGR